MKNYVYLLLSLCFVCLHVVAEIPSETIDLGDNPNNYDNQGVWIIPELDDNGMWESYFVKYNGDHLWYRADDRGNTIPDFSYCGYKMGNEEIPQMPVVATLSPIAGDARSYIQSVIDSVAQNVALNESGIRGAILLKAGVYNISGTLNINASGIVLRGEGQDESIGTVLVATSTSGSINNKEKLIRIGTSSGSLSTHSGVNISVPYIPVGSKHVMVSKGHSFAVGDMVAIYQVFNNKLVEDLGMNAIPDGSDGTPSSQWSASSYSYYYEREVHRVSSAGALDDSIVFYNPIVQALDQDYNASRRLYKASFASRISQSGVENMLLKSVYADDTDESHAWDAVYFDCAEDCWAKGITSKHFAYSLANISKQAKYITVYGCACLSPKSEVTGSRRYSFNVDGQMCLVKNCFSSEGRHDYAQGSRVCGPNVFSKCIAENASNDIGPHHRWSTGSLFDQITTDGTINVQDRGASGSGHGWAGATMVFWACEGESAVCQNPQVYAHNYNIGFIGEYKEASMTSDRPRGEWEGNNVEGLNIASLYDEQRKDRGLDVEFGLASNRITYVNDTTFRLIFNDSLDTVTATDTSNYVAQGSAGILGHPTKATVIEECVVELAYETIGTLGFDTRLDIQITGVNNTSGDSILGFHSTHLTIPDMRPVVTLDHQSVDNSGLDSVIVSSSKAGDVYLAFVMVVPKAVDDLESGIAKRKVAVVRNVSPNEDAKISPKDLLRGMYYVYAVDEEGRISRRSSDYVSVSYPSSLQGVEQNTFASVYYTSQDQSVHVTLDHSGLAQLKVFDMFGRLLLADELSMVHSTFPLDSSLGMVVVNIRQGDDEFTAKLLLL